MARNRPWEVRDDVWEMIRPLLPQAVRTHGNAGRPRLDDRQALSGILFVLYTGMPWQQLPQELGYGSGVTCWRRLHEWRSAATWPRLRQVLTTRLAVGAAIDPGPGRRRPDGRDPFYE